MVSSLYSDQDPWLRFQYSLCRVVLMVNSRIFVSSSGHELSVLALSSRFDGRSWHSIPPAAALFQYSLCRVVLMVLLCRILKTRRLVLSVLALSSRFDGHGRLITLPSVAKLSVLALSSRFDGRSASVIVILKAQHFQYSLCRVVLMVAMLDSLYLLHEAFQYSLCRVVLMVLNACCTSC